MIPYDSFLLDPFLLFFIGAIGGRLDKRIAEKDKNSGALKWVLGAVILVMFYITSVSLYFNGQWTEWIAKMGGAECGRDFMLNSGVFNFDYENPSAFTHIIAVLIFLTYPLWLVLGYKIGSSNKGDLEEA